MELSKAHLFFSSRYYCERGFHFQAQLMALPLQISDVSFNHPRRVLKMAFNVNVHPRDIVRTVSGERFILTDHGASEMKDEVLFKYLRLYKVTHNATWVSHSNVETVDPITGAKKQTTTGATETIPVTIEFQRQQEDEMRIQADVVRILSPRPIAVNDHINEYVVLNVEPQLGIYIATARRR